MRPFTSKYVLMLEEVEKYAIFIAHSIKLFFFLTFCFNKDWLLQQNAVLLIEGFL